MDIYFTTLHRYLPLLHEPTFRRDIAAGLHLEDRRFGAVTLLVCALAARRSHDPRAFVDAALEQSAGWQWYVQATVAPPTPLERMNVHDVQRSCVRLFLRSCRSMYLSLSLDTQLAAEYLTGTSSPQAAWHEIGNAIRTCILLGYHRLRPRSPTVESELQKRAFWYWFPSSFRLILLT